MDSCKGKENCILPQEITMWDSLGSTRKKEEEYIIGQVRKAMFTKESSKLASAMDEEPFGGVTEVGTKVSLETGCKVDGEPCIEKVEIASIKEIGITACLMEKELSTSRMAKDTREPSNKTSSMDRASFTKMTQ